MLVTVADEKPQVVSPGHELRLAQAEIFKEDGTPEEDKPSETDETGETEEPAGEMSTTTKVVLGTIAVVGIAAAAAGGGGGGDGGGSPPPASPGSP
jgi:hypothetical protein